MTVNKLDLIAFVFGFGWSTTVSIFGQLYLAEVVAVIFLFTLHVNRELSQSRVARRVVLGYGLFLVGLVVSDLYNGTPVNDALRGWANPVFAVVDMLFVAALLRRRNKSLIPILAGIALGQLIAKGLPSPSESLSNANDLKSHLVPILAPLALLAATASTGRTKSLASVVFFSTGLFLLVFGARSSGLIFLSSGVISFFYRRFARLGGWAIFGTVVALLPIAYSGFVMYVDYILSRGGAGNSTWQIQMMTNPFNPMEWIIYGRSDAVVAIAAIGDRPWLGHGSWARDVGGIYSALNSEILNIDRVTYSDIIRGHSVILTATVWGGVLGLIGMLTVAVSSLQGIRGLLDSRSYYHPVAWYFVVEFIWNLMFSPLGHIRTSFYFVTALAVAAPYLGRHAPPSQHAAVAAGRSSFEN